MSSDDSHARDDLWARHYREAAKRRRARGWHRRDDASFARRKRHVLKVYFGVAALFVGLIILALLLPR